MESGYTIEISVRVSFYRPSCNNNTKRLATQNNQEDCLALSTFIVAKNVWRVDL